MTNENVELRCPRCGSKGEILVTCTHKYALCQDGALRDNGHEPKYYEDSVASCAECCFGQGGKTTVADFRIPKSVRQMLLEVAEKILDTDKNMREQAKEVDSVSSTRQFSPGDWDRILLAAKAAVEAANQHKGLKG